MLVTRIYFKCNGCGVEWYTELDKVLRTSEDVIEFLRLRMPPCPNTCGARSADVAFKMNEEKKT